MKQEKKNYERPTVLVYGNIEKLTHQGGGSLFDVPMGTPVSAIGTISASTVTGELS